MARKQHATDDIRLTDEELRTMRPIADVMPASFVAELEARQRRRGRPKQAVTKQLISLRLDRETIDAYRSTGRGWQSRIDEDLAKAARRRVRQRPGA